MAAPSAHPPSYLFILSIVQRHPTALLCSFPVSQILSTHHPWRCTIYATLYLQQPSLRQHQQQGLLPAPVLRSIRPPRFLSSLRPHAAAGDGSRLAAHVRADPNSDSLRGGGDGGSDAPSSPGLERAARRPRS